MENYPLSVDDELPVKDLPALTEWSENYAFVCYDHDRKVGFAAYIGRWVKNPVIWREQFFVYLPDGSCLSSISFGKAPSREQLTAGCLTFCCEKPGGRWTIDYEGPMRHDFPNELMKEPVEQANVTNVKFHLDLDHEYPVWMFPGADGNTTFGKFHYEQMGHGIGRIEVNGKQIDFAAPSYRDHSRGPRNLSHFDGHLWLQLHFPSGVSFSTYQVWHNDGDEVHNVLNLAASFRPGEIREAAVVELERLRTPEKLWDPFSITIAMEGKEVALTGKPLAALTNSVSKEFELYYGLVPSIADFFNFEQPFLFECDAGLVKGYMQRTGPF